MDGTQYHFVTKDEFAALADQGAFVERATFSGNFYGTSVAAVRDVAEKGRVCVLEIEMEVGAPPPPPPLFPPILPSYRARLSVRVC